MKIQYNREDDVLLIETLLKDKIDHAEHTGPFIAHFSENGKLLLLEVLDASNFISDLIKHTMRGKIQEIPQ